MIAPAAGPWNAWPAPKNTERTKMCHSSTVSVIASTPRTPTATPRSALEKHQHLAALEPVRDDPAHQDEGDNRDRLRDADDCQRRR